MSTRKKFDSRLWNGDTFCGTWVVCGATPDGTTSFVCDVVLDSLEETTCDDTRSAFKLPNNKRGKALPPTKINEELVVVFGPGLSAIDAVTSLKLVIKQIEKEGLLIGRTKKQGDFLIETVDGKILR